MKAEGGWRLWATGSARGCRDDVVESQPRALSKRRSVFLLFEELNIRRPWMGVYVFESKHGPFLKVGHFHGENAWSRVIRRGFRRVRCPGDIADRVDAEDLELLGWFPDLTTAHERTIHKASRESLASGTTPATA